MMKGVLSVDLISAERQLNDLVERRATEKNNANAREETYKQSVRRHREKRQEQNRWGWIRFFDRMAQSHARMSEDYERRASALYEERKDG
jgi:hypothetical protein